MITAALGRLNNYISKWISLIFKERKIEDVLIDSSSLFLILKDDNLRTRLVSWIKNRKAKRRLLFSPMVLEEILDYGNKPEVIKQLLILGNIASELGPKFAWASMPLDAFKVEFLNPLSANPVANEEDAQCYLKKLSDKLEVTSFVTSYRSNPQKWKSARLKSDLNVQARAKLKVASGSSNLKRDNIISLLKKYSGPGVGSPILEGSLRDTNSDLGTSVTETELISDPRRYPFFYTWICLAELNALGNGLPENDPHEIAHRLKPDKGTWFDNSIGCTAALCKMLITEDRGLLWKCNHLNQLGLVMFTASSLKDAFNA